MLDDKRLRQWRESPAERNTSNDGFLVAPTPRIQSADAARFHVKKEAFDNLQADG
jgi:hypothetical protein